MKNKIREKFVVSFQTWSRERNIRFDTHVSSVNEILKEFKREGAGSNATFIDVMMKETIWKEVFESKIAKQELEVLAMNEFGFKYCNSCTTNIGCFERLIGKARSEAKAPFQTEKNRREKLVSENSTAPRNTTAEPSQIVTTTNDTSESSREPIVNVRSTSPAEKAPENSTGTAPRNTAAEPSQIVTINPNSASSPEPIVIVRSTSPAEKAPEKRIAATGTATEPSKNSTNEISKSTPAAMPLIRVATSSAETAPRKSKLPMSKEPAAKNNGPETIPNPFCVEHQTDFVDLLNEAPQKNVKYYCETGRYLSLAFCRRCRFGSDYLISCPTIFYCRHCKVEHKELKEKSISVTVLCAHCHGELNVLPNETKRKRRAKLRD